MRIIVRPDIVRLGPLGVQANLPKVIERTGNLYDRPPGERFSPCFPENVRVMELLASLVKK